VVNRQGCKTVTVEFGLLKTARPPLLSKAGFARTRCGCAASKSSPRNFPWWRSSPEPVTAAIAGRAWVQLAVPPWAWLTSIPEEGRPHSSCLPARGAAWGGSGTASRLERVADCSDRASGGEAVGRGRVDGCALPCEGTRFDMAWSSTMSISAGRSPGFDGLPAAFPPSRPAHSSHQPAHPPSPGRVGVTPSLRWGCWARGMTLAPRTCPAAANEIE